MTQEMEDRLKLSNVKVVAERLDVDISWVAYLCRTGQLLGSFKVNPDAKNSPWLIPETAVTLYERNRREKTK